MDIGQSNHRHRGMLHESVGMHNLETRRRWIGQHTGERGLLACLDQNRLFETQSVAIGKQQRLLQQQRRPCHHRRPRSVIHLIFHSVGNLWRIGKSLSGGSQCVVNKHCHRLALGDGAPCRISLVHLQVAVVLLHIVRWSVETDRRPLRQSHFLILQSVGQLMCQHRLLIFGLDPVQQIHGLCFVIVKSRDLLGQQREKKCAQMKVAVEQPKLLQHNLGALHTLRALVLVELFLEIVIDLITRNQFALHRMLDRQFSITAGKVEDLIHRPKQLLRLLLCHRGLRLGLRRFLSSIRSCCLLGKHHTTCRQKHEAYNPPHRTSIAAPNPSLQLDPLNPPL